MESPSGTTLNSGHQESEIPQTVEGQIAEDLELLIARVRQQLTNVHSGQREWALARTRLEEAAHWVSEARGMVGGRGFGPWFPDREVEATP